MNAFKVGDCVRVTNALRTEIIGAIGIIIFSGTNRLYKVRFLRNVAGCEEHWFKEEQLAPVQKDNYIEYIRHDIKAANELYKERKNNIELGKGAIKKVVFNNPATIIFWTDGTKTVVKAENEDFDPEKGLAMAISKKMLGNQGNYYEIFKKWLPKEDPEMDQMLVKALFDNFMAAIGRNTEEYKCSTCARFDDESMSCMISNCEKYNRYVKKDTKEESKRNPVQEAYDKLIGIRDHDEFCDFDELIGLLGEALDS